MNSIVRDNPHMRRFEMSITKDSLAAAYYRLDDGLIVLLHTEVPFEYSGKGLGSQLAEGVFGSLRQSGRKAAVRCEFLANYVARHPEHRDVIVA